MAINAKNYARAQELYGTIQSRVGSLEPNTFMYQRESEKLNKLRRSMDEFETSQRQTDEAGKLVTAPTHTRVPGTAGEVDSSKSYNFHFEPSVTEAREMLRNDPSLVDRLGLKEWTTGVAEPERIDQVADPMSGALGEPTVSPAKTHLDNLNEQDSAYKAVAQDIWEQRRNEAESRGEAIQRYRDVPLDDEHWKQYAAGGAEYIIDRRLAPAALGAANSYTAGTAAPVYDAARQPASLRTGEGAAAPGGFMPPWARALSTLGVDEQAIPSSQEVINRSPGSYLAGNILGYAGQFNPTNLAAEGAIKALGYTGRNMFGKLGTSAAVGGGINAAEGAVGDFANAMSQGQDFGDAAMTAASGMPLNAVAGAIGGAGVDTAGQVLGMWRDGYRGQARLQGLKTLEDAGGSTGVWSGVNAPPEVQAAHDASKQPGAVGTAGARLAEPVAQEIEGSLARQAADEQARIQNQMQEYFNHPTYGQLEVESRPLLETLFQLAAPGRLRGPVTGEAMHIDPRILKTIGTEARNFSEVAYVPQAEAARYAHENGGVPLDHELASQVYGEPQEFSPGTVAIAVPRPLTAQLLTELEKRIYRELGISNTSAGSDDPVLRQFDAAAKEMRDQFPLYRDAAGNLIEPPATPSQAPFPPADDMPQAGPSRPSQLPRPVELAGAQRPRPEAQPGIGPGTPDLPSSPFDPRAPKEQQPPAEQLSAPRGVGLQERPPMVREAEPGAGPGQPPLPIRDGNPFDPSPLQGVSRARLEPNAPVELRGEPARPEPIPPEAYPGIGQPRRRFGVDAEKLNPQPTKAVTGGEYDRPPAIEPEPEKAPDTLRNMGPRRPDELEPQYLAEEDVLSARPDEPIPDSQPAPTAQSWANATDEAAKWTDDILSPGSDARSAEMKRMMDLSEQETALAEARAQVENVSNRLGPIDEAKKEEMVQKIMEARMQGLSKADIIKMLAPIGIGTAAGAAAEDEETGAAMAGAGGLGAIISGRGSPGLRRWALEVQRNFGDLLDRPRVARMLANDVRTRATELGLSADEVTQFESAIGVSPPRTRQLSPEDLPTVEGRMELDPGVDPRDRDVAELFMRKGHKVRAINGRDVNVDDLMRGIPEESLDGMMPLDDLRKFGDIGVHSDVYPSEDGWLWSASGRDSKGDNAWEMIRRVTRENGELVVEHKLFQLREDLQKGGKGEAILRKQMEAYAKAGVDRVTVDDAVEVGRYYWPSIGFDNQQAVPAARKAYREYLRDVKHMSQEEIGRTIATIKSLPTLAATKHGKDFLLSSNNNVWNQNLTMVPKDSNPYFQLMKGRLNLLIGAGVGLYGLTDGSEGNDEAAGAMAGILLGAPRPKQLEAVLDDGKVVKGFSALRRGQHTEQESIERAKKRVGANSEETLPRRVQNFNQGKADVRYDDALLAEAQKIGKEKELRSAAAANVYPELNDMSTPFGGNQGFAKSTVDNLMLRLDKPLEYLSGASRNPFAREPNSLGERIQREYMADPARRLLNTTGGRPGARFGEHVRELIFDENDKEDRKRRKGKEAR